MTFNEVFEKVVYNLKDSSSVDKGSDVQNYKIYMTKASPLLLLFEILWFCISFGYIEKIMHHVCIIGLIGVNLLFVVYRDDMYLETKIFDY